MPPSLQDLISHYQHMSNFPPNLNRCPCCQSEQVTFKQHFAYKNNNNQELSHVSLWNWFKGLSVFNQYAHKAVKLLFKAVPDNSIHREFIPINPHKYQSESRRHCLEKVEFILRVIRHLSKHRINVRIFPTILN